MEKGDTQLTVEPEVVEISLEFLQMLEGFCLAASQEFPNNVVDFAARYFARILKRIAALRKYSIEPSDQALFFESGWTGTV